MGGGINKCTYNLILSVIFIHLVNFRMVHLLFELSTLHALIVKEFGYLVYELEHSSQVILQLSCNFHVHQIEGLPNRAKCQSPSFTPHHTHTHTPKLVLRATLKSD